MTAHIVNVLCKFYIAAWLPRSAEPFLNIASVIITTGQNECKKLLVIYLAAISLCIVGTAVVNTTSDQKDIRTV